MPAFAGRTVGLRVDCYHDLLMCARELYYASTGFLESCRG